MAPPPPALGQAWPAPGFSTRAMRAQWRGPGQRGPSVDLSQACGTRATACIGTLPPPLARGLGREVKRHRRNCSAGKRCQANLRHKRGGKQKKEWGRGAEKCSPVGRWPPGNSLPRRGRGKIPGWIVGTRYVGAGSSVTRRAGSSTRVRDFAPVIFRGGKKGGRDIPPKLGVPGPGEDLYQARRGGFLRAGVTWQRDCAVLASGPHTRISGF